jgi:hypothetical protein
MEPDAPHLKLVPPTADVALIRTALRELHDLAVPEHEASSAAPTQGPRWYPSMGARLTAVR